MHKIGRLIAGKACLAGLFAIVCVIGAASRPQSTEITITLAGQSMIRSDIRATSPATMPVLQGMFMREGVFSNLDAAIAEERETVQEGRGFLTPPEALDSLKSFGLNLLSLSGNPTFDLNVKGIQ